MPGVSNIPVPSPHQACQLLGEREQGRQQERPGSETQLSPRAMSKESLMTASCPGIFPRPAGSCRESGCRAQQLCELPAGSSPATGDHQRPQPQGPWQVGPGLGKLPPSPAWISRVSQTCHLRREQGAGPCGREESGPGPPLFLPADRRGPAQVRRARGARLPSPQAGLRLQASAEEPKAPVLRTPLSPPLPSSGS